MKEVRISFKLAKSAKSKGFPVFHNGTKMDYYHISSGVYIPYGTNKDIKAKDMCCASTLSYLQMWVRVKYNIHVNPFLHEKGFYSYETSYPSNNKIITDISKEEYSDYNVALEAGLLEVFESII